MFEFEFRRRIYLKVYYENHVNLCVYNCFIEIMLVHAQSRTNFRFRSSFFTVNRGRDSNVSTWLLIVVEETV